MVELRKVRLKGKWTYVEVSPEACTNGHPLFPGWGSCPSCGRKMGRLWACKVRDCDAPDQFDPEHTC